MTASFPVSSGIVVAAGRITVLVSALAAAACVAPSGGVGTAVTVATANPLLGAGAGYAADWASGKVSDYQTAQLQAAIAEAGGEARPNETVPWTAGEQLPVGQARGTLTVTDTKTVDTVPCKDVRFTIVEGPEAELGDYIGTVCRDDGFWQLAEARPATAAWTPPDAEPPAETPARDRRKESGPRPHRAVAGPGPVP